MFRDRRRRSVSATAPGAVSVGGDVNNSSITSHVRIGDDTPLEVAMQDRAELFEMMETESFTGRRWIFEELDVFRRNHDRGYFFLEAEAGMGKTGFTARLTMEADPVAHHTRLPNGANRTTAMRNLSAQLLVRYDLFDKLPKRHEHADVDRGVVPAWAQDENGFASLLRVTADELVDRNETLLVVVDGLDEAEPGPGPLPFGLPSTLPRRVFVVAAYRTGLRVTPAEETPRTVLRLSANDPRNRADIDAHLAKFFDGVDKREELIAAFKRHAKGNWGHLAPPLKAFRLGSFDLSSLEQPSVAQTRYYVRNFEEWRSTPHWHALDRPLLATLATAYEPLPVAALSDFTGLDRGTVTQACTERYRPFLDVYHRDGVRVYSPFHRTMRDFIAGTPGEDAQSEAEVVLREELRESCAASHHAIIDFYLSLFGDDLEKLAADPELGRVHHDYALKNLVRHLDAVNRHDDIRRLINTQAVVDGEPVSPWLLAQGAHNASYVDDVVKAQQIFAAETDEQESLTVESLRVEALAALRLAFDPARVARQLDLIGPAVLFGLSSPATLHEALQSVGHPAIRCRGLVALLPHAPDRHAYEQEALRLLQLVHQPFDRAEAAAALLSELPFRTHAAQARAALDAAQTLTDPEDRAAAFLMLSPFLPETDLITQALALIRTLDDASARAEWLAVAARSAPQAARRSLCYEALSGADATLRPILSARMLDHCPSEIRDDLWSTAHAEHARMTGLVGVNCLLTLAHHASVDTRDRLLRTALRTARAIPLATAKATAMTRVLKAVDPAQDGP